MQRNKHTLLDLLVNGLETLEMNLPLRGPRRPIVAVYIADRGGEDVDSRGDELVDVFGGGEECY